MWMRTFLGDANHRSLWRGALVAVVAGLGLLTLLGGESAQQQAPGADPHGEYTAVVRPLLRRYCMDCHSTKVKKGSLDLERFASVELARRDLKPWQQLIERVDAAEMPPKARPQPTDEERRRLLAWARGFLDAEGRARAGDPGLVPLRRLSNAEYDCTIRGLTGVDLRPTREFPADGAAGEGFTNAAEALSDISPTLFDKYLTAAKGIAEHAVLLPDGFRFSPTSTRRDWTDESTTRLRQFYAAYAAGDGRLPVQPYLAAAVRHRDALVGGKVTPEEIAAKEKLNPKYFAILWRTLTGSAPSYPLDALRARWRTANEGDVPALAATVDAWQTVLWKTVRVGSYVHPTGKGYAESTARQIAADPTAVASVPLRTAVKPVPGQSDVTLFLNARDLLPAGAGPVVWDRPRFEAAGKPPLLLRDYADFGPAYEIDPIFLLSGSSKYLAAAAETGRDPKRSTEDLAKERGLDAAYLKRWVEVLASPPPKAGEAPTIPPDSVLGRWRAAVADPARQEEATRLALQVESLFTGPRPAKEKDPDRTLYDKLAAVDGPLFAGLDAARLAKPQPKDPGYGLTKKRFGTQPTGPTVDDASLATASGEVVEVRLPAALFVGREFVADGRPTGDAAGRVVQFRVLTAAPAADARWDGASPVAAASDGEAYRRLLSGHADFRNCFPLFLCFPPVVPNDEVVSLKMFHREDEPLERLFLDAGEQRRLDRLWSEHRFISRQPEAENSYLPLFIGFVTQDQPKEMVAFFEGQRPAFQKRADEFKNDEEAAVPRQLDALLDFAGRAYRRPLSDKEKTDLLGLYKAIREKGVGHEEAFRGVLARVLAGPAFLFRVEQAPAGKDPGPVNDWELATRLSYFLWSSAPDDELRDLAEAGRLHDPEVLAAQTRRMLRDDRLRSLAVEFGTQWIHVRGFDEFNEKNEQLFPTFTADMRKALYEEAILFFQDLFQNDRAVTQVLDADHTFLNEPLAKYYGIPDVTGPQWRRVEGVQKYGRGGILGLGSVQARQAGASRTSPVLRGNWVVETLLGEKLPRPPPDVPRLPEEEANADGLTMRQRVEQHARTPSCAVCHQRMDPFGFALERYDAAGRRRDKDLGGLALDTKVRLKDGTEFEGLEGLRSYLLTKKKDVVVRLFCRRLLGYALGRSVELSDQPLIDQMVAELDKNDGRLSAAVLTIVRSQQFRMIRGRDYDGE